MTSSLSVFSIQKVESLTKPRPTTSYVSLSVLSPLKTSMVNFDKLVASSAL